MRDKDWNRYVPIIMEWLKEVTHDTTEETPNYLQLRKKTPRFWYQVLNLETLENDTNENLKIRVVLAKRKIQVN